MKHLHFIVNPAAGGGSCLQGFAAIQELLAERGVDYSVAYSEFAGHTSRLAHQAVAAEYDYVVAVGGDGTVREVAQALLHKNAVMGIIPFGTGNDAVKGMHIPGDPRAALELLLTGKSRWVDVATANDEVYINVAGFGFDVEVLQKTLHYKNRVQGKWAYILGVIHALIALRSYKVCITTAREKLELDALLVAVGNGTSIGGGMQVTPLADVADGQLDVCVVRKLHRLSVLWFLARFIRGEHLGLNVTRYFKAKEVVVECVPNALVQLDGEIIGSTPVTFKILPKALSMITE